MNSVISSESPGTSERAHWVLGKGWRSGIVRGSILASFVFVVNIVITGLAVSKSKTSGAGQKTVYEGDCDRVKQLDTYLHLLINILSTILLGASNYAMQCLSAPTRSEVDRAHSRRDWVDVGVLSIRNLSKINSRRVLLWSLLMVSSLPLHLFYNSTIYSSIYSADYGVFMITEDALAKNASSTTLGIDPNNPWINDTQTDVGYYWPPDDGAMTSDYTLVNVTSTLYGSAVNGSLARLNTSECMTTYATTFPTRQGNLILVTNNATWTPFVYVYETMTPIQDMNAGCPAVAFDWICSQLPKHSGGCHANKPCSSRLSELDADDWRPFGNRIEYCLSQPVEEKCSLSLNPPLIIVVIIFNLAKAILLLLTVWTVKDHPLITIGDSIASFLRRGDKTTKDLCLMGRDGLEAWKLSGSQRQKPEPSLYVASRKRWGSVATTGRVVFLAILYLSMLIICIILFIHGVIGRIVPASTLMKLAPGSLDPDTFIQGWSVPSFGVGGLLSNVLIANSPQVLLSTIYFTYNSLFTSFLLGAEWNSFARQRKGLRVSAKPMGEQRATYFLQLPFQWSVPLMVLSAVLHWLCSQSLFLVSIEFDHLVTQAFNPSGSIFCTGAANDLGTDGLECFDRYVTCGYNPISILATIALGILMVVFAFFISFRRYKNAGLPVAGTCSAAISASCHLLPTEGYDANGSDMLDAEVEEVGERAAVSKLQWGEMDTPLIYKGAVQVQEVELDDVEDSKTATGATQRTRTYHCGFSHQEVIPPREGQLYAGWSSPVKSRK